MSTLIRVTLETWTGPDSTTYTLDAVYVGPMPADLSEVRDRLAQVLEEKR